MLLQAIPHAVCITQSNEKFSDIKRHYRQTAQFVPEADYVRCVLLRFAATDFPKHGNMGVDAFMEACFAAEPAGGIPESFGQSSACEACPAVRRRPDGAWWLR